MLVWCQILDELLRSDEDEDPITAHMFANSSQDDIRRYEAGRETERQLREGRGGPWRPGCCSDWWWCCGG